MGTHQFTGLPPAASRTLARASVLVAMSLATTPAASVAAPAAAPAMSHASLQPTFGRPKDTRPEEPDPATTAKPTGQSPKPLAVPPVELWRDDDPARLRPITGAEAGEVYAWQFQDGTRFAYSLPEGFDRRQTHNVIVLLHPARTDFRWGLANHPRPGGPRAGRSSAMFRPRDIVVSIDGLGGDPRAPNQRYFDPDQRNMVRFRDILLEVTRTFPVRRIYLYGSGDAPLDAESGGGGGGGFVAAFTGAFPALADGAIVHASGLFPDSASKNTVPIIFLHGDKDALTPLRRAADAVNAFKAMDHSNVRLRVIRGFNDYPSSARAAECISDLIGRSDDDPERVLTEARELLQRTGPDEFNFVAAPWFGAGYEVLGRLTGDTKPAVDDVPEQLKAEATALRAQVVAHAERCIDSIKAMLKTDDLRSLPIDGGPWLGALPALRDDFRGVPIVDAFAAEIGYDVLAAEHDDGAIELHGAWEERQTEEGATLESILRILPQAYLSPSLPPQLSGWTRAALRKADELDIPPDIRTRAEFIQLLDQGQREGLSAYLRLHRSWELPEPAAPATSPAQPGE
jgi:hypothetical protein